jgi:hypothetical protein
MPTKRVAVLQSNYLPWKGYFDIIHDADLFIFYDDIQFTKNDWRNRNRIKTAQGAHWLTVHVGDAMHRLVCDVPIVDSNWQTKHWRTLRELREVLLGRYREYRNTLSGSG